MLIEAVVEKGQVRFLQPVTFVHDYFSVKVDIPDKEVVLQDGSVGEPMSKDAGCAESEYPAEYLAFKKLQEAVFGKEYKYAPEKNDCEILVEALCEKYA